MSHIKTLDILNENLPMFTIMEASCVTTNVYNNQDPESSTFSRNETPSINFLTKNFTE